MPPFSWFAPYLSPVPAACVVRFSNFSLGCPCHYSVEQKHSISGTGGTNLFTPHSWFPTLPSYCYLEGILICPLCYPPLPSLHVARCCFPSFKIFTYSKFLQHLWSAFHAIGLPARDSACHSFQRGGASFAFQTGLPVELIKILGDWHSDAVLLYLTVPLSVRIESINVIAKVILSYC